MKGQFNREYSHKHKATQTLIDKLLLCKVFFHEVINHPILPNMPSCFVSKYGVP